MNTFQLFSDQVTCRLAWVLIHFVWQGSAIAAIVALSLFQGRFRRPSSRYAICLVGLMTMAVCPIATLIVSSRMQAPITSMAQPSVSTTPIRRPLIASSATPMVLEHHDGEATIPRIESNQGLTIVIAPESGDATQGTPLETNSPESKNRNIGSTIAFIPRSTQSIGQRSQLWIVASWLAGIFVFSVRLLFGWIGVWRFRRRVAPVPAWISERLFQLSDSLRIARPLIHLSERVTEAIATGFIRPMILLPASWATELPSDMIEAVILHELAHIRRGDLWVNMLQRLIETLLFYHPAVWWLSHRIRIEREFCCDEQVVLEMKNPVRYAETLEHIGRLNLASSFGLLHPSTGLSVSIGSQRGFLLKRIRAILGVTPRERASVDLLTGVLPLVFACLIVWLTFGRNPAPASDDGASSGVPQKPSIQATNNTDTSTIPSDVPRNAVEPKPAGHEKPIDGLEAFIGQVTTDDGSSLPADLKLFRRVSSELTFETPVSPDGKFSFKTKRNLGSARFSMTASGFAPFDSNWLKLDQPIALKLSRGATVTLRFHSSNPPFTRLTPEQLRTLLGIAGTSAASATLIVPWWDNEYQGTTVIDGIHDPTTISHCPKSTVKIDLLIPGFEEIRLHRLISGDVSIDVPLKVAKRTRFRVVSSRDGRPIADAKVRLFSRVRAGSFLQPFQWDYDSPVCGESNADGLVELTNLAGVDPVPTNDPGSAVYAIRIDAPNHPPQYVGNVQAGRDLGDIVIGDSLEVRGEVARDAQNPERISLQIRQPTVAQGGADGRGNWTKIDTVEVGGKLTFHATGLHAGPFDMFIVYSNPQHPSNTPGGTIQQLQFHGLLKGNSSNLMISRKSVTPGDDSLTARRASLFPIDDYPPSNLPHDVVEQLVGRTQIGIGEEGAIATHRIEPTAKMLFTWSVTSPVQHSMGHVAWRIFVEQDGTVFVPIPNEAGTLYKLSATELQEFKDLLERNRELFGQVVPSDPPELAGWKHGSTSLSYSTDQETKVFTLWECPIDHPFVGEPKYKVIEAFINQLIVDAACGGPAVRTKYRDIASQVLVTAAPSAPAFQNDDLTYSRTESDGTRHVTFNRGSDKSSVTLVQPVVGDLYVERIEFQGKRVALNSELPASPRVVVDHRAEPASRDARSDGHVRFDGTVVDARGAPVAGALVLYPVRFDRAAGKWRVVRTTSNEVGEFHLDVPMLMFTLPPVRVHHIAWSWAKGHGIGAATIAMQGTEPNQAAIRIQLPDSESSEFVVLDENAKPVPGAIVTPGQMRVPNGTDPIDGFYGLYYPVPDELRLVTSRETDEAGHVRLESVPRKLLDSVKVVTGSHGEQEFQHAPQNLQLRPVAAVNGRLIGAPREIVGRVRLHVATTTGEVRSFVQVETDDEGRFAIHAFPTGQYHVDSSFGLNAPWLLGTGGTISHGQASVDVTVEHGIPIKGRLVVRESNRGVPAAIVAVRFGTNLEHHCEVTSNEDGMFTACVLAGQKVRVQVCGFSPDARLMIPDMKFFDVPNGAEEFSLPDLLIDSTVIWNGTLIDETGVPIEGSYVSPVGIENTYPERTDSKGGFQLALPKRDVPTAWEVVTSWPVNPNDKTSAELVSNDPLVIRVRRSPTPAKSSVPSPDAPSVEPDKEGETLPNEVPFERIEGAKKGEIAADDDLFVVIQKGRKQSFEFDNFMLRVDGFDPKVFEVKTLSATKLEVEALAVGHSILVVTDKNGTEFSAAIEVRDSFPLPQPEITPKSIKLKPRKSPLRPLKIDRNQTSIDVFKGDSVDLEFGHPVRRVDGHDPQIVDVGAMPGMQLRVHGLSVGETTMIVELGTNPPGDVVDRFKVDVFVLNPSWERRRVRIRDQFAASAEPARFEPNADRNRILERRLTKAIQNGGSVESERAVESSLKWLASVQEQDGRWSSSRFGGGSIQTDPFGQPRLDGGKFADSGITGLVVLSFLRAGYTNGSDTYGLEIRKAINWLIAQQQPNGFLGGNATRYDENYCHSIATLALTEAQLAQSNSEGVSEIKHAVERAIGLIESKQNEDGGWRYGGGSMSDMSMSGWHIIALKTATDAGFKVSGETYQRAFRFLDTWKSGAHQGLAGYKKGDRPTPSMTAEAFHCRQIFSGKPDEPAVKESIDYLRKHLPRLAEYDEYYWYFGTLAMSSRGGNEWREWNTSLRDLLLSLQQNDGPYQGSWNPQGKWAGIGGRLYSTALNTMCLEAYYKYPRVAKITGRESND